MVASVVQFREQKCPGAAGTARGVARVCRGDTSMSSISHCATCGNEITNQNTGRGRKKKRCDACRPKRWSGGTPLGAVERCEMCACEFTKTAPGQKTCGDHCSAELQRWASRNKRRGPKCVCRGCGKSFVAKVCDRTTYCSRECCFADWSRQRKKRSHPVADAFLKWVASWCECEHCGATFTSYLPTVARWCSRRCEWDSRTGLEFGKSTCCDCGVTFQVFLKTRSPRCRECWAERRKEQARAARTGNGTHRRRARKYGVEYVPFKKSNVFKRDKWRCQMCGKKTTKKHGNTHDDYPELDHVMPMSLGGDHTMENTQCLCRACNAAKSNKHPAEVGVGLF